MLIKMIMKMTVIIKMMKLIQISTNLMKILELVEILIKIAIIQNETIIIVRAFCKIINFI